MRRASFSGGSQSGLSNGDPTDALAAFQASGRYAGRRESLPIMTPPGSLLSISERSAPSIHRSISGASQESHGSQVYSGRMRRRSSLPAVLSSAALLGPDSEEMARSKPSKHLPLDGGMLMMDGKIFKAPSRSTDKKIIRPQEAQVSFTRVRNNLSVIYPSLNAAIYVHTYTCTW